jgi:NAD(P)-dependent dehydrogenase (short-subunit alcohol dehydrogenase family)
MSPYTLPHNAVWFITGCSTGIGHTLSHYLATQTTSRIVTTARNPTTLSTLPSTPNVLKLALDVTSESSIRAAITATLEKFGRIDVLVNNAGYGLRSDAEITDLTIARGMMDTNFWGAVQLTQLMLPIFREQNAENGGEKGGLVIQVTSLGGRAAFAGNTFYHASKFALEGWTEGLSKELLADWNIHFLCAEPGGVKTEYNETSKSFMDRGNRHPAYTDPSSPTNQMFQYLDTPQTTASFAEPEKVVDVLYKYVEKGGEMPLRLPLGSDAWGMLKAGAESNLEDLKRVKGISTSTSGKEQFESIAFLR